MVTEARVRIPLIRPVLVLSDRPAGNAPEWTEYVNPPPSGSVAVS